MGTLRDLSASSSVSTLLELVGHRASAEGEQRLYTFLDDAGGEEGALSYEELGRRARRIATALQGLSPGDRVVLLYPPGLEYVAGFFGCLHAGLVAVPAYPPDPSRLERTLPRLLAIIRDARATAVLTTSFILGMGEFLFEQAPDLKSLRWVATDELPVGLEADWREPDVGPDSLAFLQYTSGSTGTPKGVMLSHRNLLHNLELITHAFRAHRESVGVIWLPPYHDMGLIGGVLEPLFVGFPVVLMSPMTFLKRPQRWLEAVSRYRATISGGPNFAFELCTRRIPEAERQALDLSSWEVAFCGAEPIRSETLDRFVSAFGACGFRRQSFYSCYGLAEGTLIVTGSERGQEPVLRTVEEAALQRARVEQVPADRTGGRVVVGCGRTLPDQRVLIVHPETRTRCAGNEVGEIWVSGPSVALGYWQRPEETERSFQARLADGGTEMFLRTGDLGFMLDGELFVAGRRKDLIILRGRNLYPQDLELTVEQCHPAMRPGCGAAFSVEVGGEERLVVVQELDPRQPADPAQVLGAMRQALSEGHEVQPHALVLLEPGSIPKTSSGKIQRHACKAGFLEGELRTVLAWRETDAAVEPEPEASAPVPEERLDTPEALESWLRARLAARLRVPAAQVDGAEPITRLGLDSMAAVELTHDIEKTLGLVLPMEALLQGPSLFELSRRLWAQRGGASVGVRLQRRTWQGAPPLSFAQQRLWFLDQLEPGSPAYNIPAAVWLEGALDTEALERCFREVVRRHESLRTFFPQHEGTPSQHILPELALSVARVDLEPLPEAGREAEALRRAREEARQPFALASGPLLRVTLVRLDANRHLLVTVMHHIVSDGWSMGVLIREVAALYAAFREGRASPLAPLPVQYSDYAGWQREALGGEVLEAQLSWWRQQLHGVPQALELPTDRVRPAVLDTRGAALPVRLPPELSAALKTLAHREGVTPFMVLLAAFQVVLSRYSGQEDFCVGTPIAGRGRAELEGLVGFFVNTLVLRARLAGDPSFRELLVRAREEALGAYAHQDVPFERLVEMLQPGRDLGRSPLFQVMLVLQQDTLPELKLSGLALRPQDVDSGTAKFELTLSLTDTAEGFAGMLQYNVELFDAATVERLAGHLRTLLEGALARPELRLSELPLLPEAERHQLLAEWRGTRETFGESACLHTMFEAWAARTPDAVAVVAGEHALTYRELNARANQLARHLRALGVGPDQRVGLGLERSVDALVGLLGILKAGGAYVPLDDTFPDERLRSILEDAGARVLVTAAPLAGRFAGFPGTLVRLDSEREVLAGLDAVDLPCAASPENLVYAIFTSGSTGRPKGVAIEHRQLVHYVRAVIRRLELPEGARFASVSTLAADLGHTSLFPSLCLGGTLLLVSREHASDPSALAGWFERHAVDCLKIVPSHLGALLASDAAARVLPRQRLILGGESTDPALIARVRELAPDCEIHNHYGPTETTVGVLTCHLTRGRTFESVPLGRPLTNVEVYVLDARMRPVPVGVPGELYIGGASVARGYLGRPDLTAERFIPSPFGSEPGGRLYRTGDRVRWLPEGVLEFLGRFDDQLKIRGFRIEPGEVEATLAHHPAVREAVVLARGSTSGDRRLVAYAVPRAGVSLLPGALRSFLEEKLPAYMVPSAFVVLEALPLTPNGKVDRAALPVPAASQEVARSYVAPRTPAEEVLAGLWAQVLGVERVGVHDDFFALGGHSLLATRAISRIRSAFRLEVPLRELFEAPTVAALVQRLEALARAGAEWRRPPVLPEPRTAPLPLSFAQQRLWFLDQLQPGSAFYNVPAMVRMEGHLDAEVLERGLREVIRRHEVLRSTFHASPEGPVQVVAPAPEQVLARVDLREVPAGAREDEVRRLALAEATRPFDLGRGPLVRCTLLRLEDSVHVVLLTLHHIVSDGWSMGLLIREVGALYGAFLAGQPSPLPELPVQYADHAVWQRRWLRGEVMETQLSWWKQQLEGAPAVLELPSDRPRPAVQTFQGALLSTQFSPQLAGEIRQLAEREGCTPFMVLMAAFQALLFRYTGQTDVLVGTDIANRHHAETEGLIGFFVNQLVLRGRPSGALSFRELLAQVRETSLGAYAHQDLPFEELVKAVNPERSLAHSPLFQVKLILQNARDVALELPGLTLRSEGKDSGAAKFDLTVVFTDSSDGLSCVCEYSTDLFDEGTVARLQGHLRTVLEGAVAAPEQRLSVLPLLTAEERRQVLVEWNGNRGEVAPPGLCAHEIFAAQAARTPDAVAISFAERQLTYAQLDRRANQVARHLRTLGVGPDMVVGLCVERSPELVVGLLGILKAGAAWLPLDSSLPAERLSMMMGDAAVPVLVTQELLADELPSLGELLVCLDSDAAAFDAQPETPPGTGVVPDSLAYVIYTSGSTGRPKGVLLTHHGLSNMALMLARARGVGPGSRVLQLASPSFDVFVSEVFSALLTGARLCMADREALRPGPGLLTLLEELAITTVGLPPSLMAQLDSSGLPALTTLFTGGDVCAPEVARRWSAGRRFLIEYGPTETTICATLNEEAGPERLGIGRPMQGVQAYLLDEALQPVPVGVPGEVYLGGVGVGRGYLGRPDLTAERFMPVPFGGESGARMYRTGDLARWRADGELVFVGRVDQQVKVRGFRIELGEVEGALSEHPGVREAVVMAREDVPGHKRLVAYLVAHEGEALEPEALRDFLKSKLPDYMVPALFVELESLPLTPNKKVDRKALPVPEVAQVGRKGQFAEPGTSKEKRLAAIWAQVLGVAQVGLHDNFFELGGDSIVSLQIISRARQAGLVLSARQIFECQTLAELAAAAEEAGEGARAAGEQGPVVGEVPLTPVQRWFFAQELPQPHHYNQAVLLEVRQALEVPLLKGALAALWAHHDALRSRFTRVDGRWEQHFVAPEPVSVLRRVDLSGEPEERHTAVLQEVAAELHGGFDLATGPLVKAALLERGQGRTGWLLLVVHHLVMDGVSWRVLLEDLEVAYRQLAEGTQVALPPKTASYKQWAERLAAFANSPELEREAGYWKAQAAKQVAALPVDGAGGPNTRASARRVSVMLDTEETQALLQAVPTAWRARIDEVLLGALSLALARWTGERRLRVELEGHGREAPFDGVDVSRTVGWFTAGYPVVMELPARLSPGDAVRAVRDSLRSVPHRGLGYGLLRYLRDDETAATLRAGQPAQVAFNYLGQFDATAAASSLFGSSPESSGPAQGEGGARTHLLEVGGIVLGGRLKLDWTYSENLHSRASLEALANECVSVLRALIARADPADLLRYTPADFPLAGLEQAALERVLPSGSSLEDLYPLSPLQEGMLFHSTYSPRSGEYFEQVTCTFHVPMDVAAFRRAWREAVTRHGILRTGFLSEGLEQPLQAVHATVELPWQELDWSTVPSEEQATRLEALLAEDRARGFDLSRPPLMRLTLIRLDARVHRLVWSFHHLLLDGWSVGLLLKEIFAFYGAFRQGRTPQPPRGPAYREYIAWLRKQDVEGTERYWREALAGFSASTPLPSDKGAGRAEASGTRTLHLELSEQETAALQEFARGNQLTLSTLVQGAWALLLGRYAGQEDVLFGATVSGRPPELAGSDAMVGLLINSLPVRVRLPSGEGVAQWLRGLQARLAGLRQHESSPLVRVQGWSDVPRGLPLFESLVAFENYPLDASVWEGVEDLGVRDYLAVERTNFPLTLVVTPGKSLLLKLTYVQARFEAAAVGQVLEHLRTLMGSLAARPEAPLAAVPMLKAEERNRLLVEWNATRTEYPRHASIHELFEEQVARRPESVAVEYEGQRLTYAELNRRANQVARHLRRLGVVEGSRVGLCAGRSLEMVVATLGILKAGGAYVPLDPGYPSERLAFMLEDTALAVLLVQPELLSKLPPSSAKVVELEPSWAAFAQESGESLGERVSPASLAYIMYTSGSTGRPKGVCVPHRAVVRLVKGSSFVEMSEREVYLQFAPISFDAATLELWGALLNGAKLVVFPAGTPSLEELGRALVAHQVSTLWLSAALFEQMMVSQPEALAGVKQVLAGGDVLSPTRVKQRLEAGGVLVNGYGPTENTTFTCCYRMTEPGQVGATVSIGRPIANTWVYVLDERMQPVPVGVPGELYAGGDGLALGYLNRPELTAEKFVPDPFSQEPGARLYRTGDLVRYLPDGRIEFLGRRDTQVKVRGFRIELGEVEEALAKYPGVEQVVAVVREDAPGDKRLVAYVVPRSPTSPISPLPPGEGRGEGVEDPGLNLAQLRGFVKELLPEYMVPSAFVTLEALPLSPNGKVDRKALPAPQSVAGQESSGFDAPRTPQEELLAGVWAQVLGVKRVGVHDSFFELGGHSLLATQVVSRIRGTFQVEIPLRDVFEAPTVAELAKRVDAALQRGQGSRLPPLQAVTREGELPLSFAQQRLWFLSRLEPQKLRLQRPGGPPSGGGRRRGRVGARTGRARAAS
ncbi:amino acid adenylation domain-containing protein [Archangium gephyra]|uniref:amino acid adenylation domain-containing protein n=1 Tax=Archangium gephyra TaxID=48 RepID=UPI003B7BD1E2